MTAKTASARASSATESASVRIFSGRPAGAHPAGGMVLHHHGVVHRAVRVPVGVDANHRGVRPCARRTSPLPQEAKGIGAEKQRRLCSSLLLSAAAERKVRIERNGWQRKSIVQ